MKHAPDTSALFARLERHFRQTEKLLAELIRIYPLYSCALPRLYARQIYQMELLQEIKRDFETNARQKPSSAGENIRLRPQRKHPGPHPTPGIFRYKKTTDKKNLIRCK